MHEPNLYVCSTTAAAAASYMRRTYNHVVDAWLYITYIYMETIIRVFPFKNMNTEGCDNQPKRVLLDRVIVQEKMQKRKDRFI